MLKVVNVLIWFGVAAVALYLLGGGFFTSAALIFLATVGVLYSEGLIEEGNKNEP